MIINNGFTTIDNSIDYSVLKTGEFRLFIAISQCCFGDNDSYALLQQTLAEKLHVCVRTIQRWLQGLIKKGFITTTRRGHKSSIYTLLKGKFESRRQKLKGLIATSQKSTSNSQNKFYNKKNKKKLKCDNFEKRNYDLDSLEKKLLGWDEE